MLTETSPVFQSEDEAVLVISYPVSKAMAKVPAVVIGEPLMVNPVGTVWATEVTVPVPAVASQETPRGAVEEAIRTLPLVPIVNPFQPVDEATTRLPVEVAIEAKSFH